MEMTIIYYQRLIPSQPTVTKGKLIIQFILFISDPNQYYLAVVVTYLSTYLTYYFNVCTNMTMLS